MTTQNHITTYEQVFILNVAPDRLFAALTDPEHLERWFAQHTRIEPRVGGAFCFWGKHTPWTPGERDATQKISAFNPGALISFHWPWAGSEGDVSLEVVRAAGGSSLNIHHEARGPIQSYGPNETPWVLKDFWTLSIGNLREYLKTGEPALRPDFSTAGGDVVMSIVINAPASVVWNALTDARELDKWLTEKARVSFTPGGKFSYGWVMPDGKTVIGPAKLLEIEPGRRLLHDWNYVRDKTTRTEWTVDPIGQKASRLTVRQVGTGDGRESAGYTSGWGRFLLRAKALLEDMPLY